MNDWIVILVNLVACIAIVAGVGGCAQGGRGESRESRQEQAREAAITANPRAIQAATMSFADRYVAAMADEYDRAKLGAKTPQDAIMAQRLKILAAMGAMENAVDPNPLVGLMDMAIMVTLCHEISQAPWTVEMFGKENAAAITAALQIQEADIWRTASAFITPVQIEELHQLAARWRSEHPDQRYVASARLADFPEGRPSGGGGGNPGVAVQQLASSVFGIVSLDPFHGLDPAVKEVAETRILAERLFFYLRHAAIMMTWQTDSLFDQMMAQPQMTKLFADTTTIAGSTTRFTDSTNRFSDASAALANTIEKFRLEIPDRQATLVNQLDGLVARQRQGALLQATTQVSAQREAAIQQLGTTVTAQQDLMTKNLQVVTDQSIDRAYQRSRALVLITVGAIFLAFVLYRLLVAARHRAV